MWVDAPSSRPSSLFIKCDRCDLNLPVSGRSDSRHRYYGFEHNQIAPVESQHGWCLDCEAIKEIESLPTPEKVLELIKEFKNNLDDVDKSGNATSPYPLYTNYIRSIISSRDKWIEWSRSRQLPLCLTCGSENILLCGAHFGRPINDTPDWLLTDENTAESFLDFSHPGCGGNLTIKSVDSGFCISWNATQMDPKHDDKWKTFVVYSPDGLLIDPLEILTKEYPPLITTFKLVVADELGTGRFNPRQPVPGEDEFPILFRHVRDIIRKNVSGNNQPKLPHQLKADFPKLYASFYHYIRQQVRAVPHGISKKGNDKSEGGGFAGFAALVSDIKNDLAPRSGGNPLTRKVLPPTPLPQCLADEQFNLGSQCANGSGMPQSYAKAWEWWEQAAAQGHAQAQHNLGKLYYEGKGVPYDYDHTKAAEAGNAKAQFNQGQNCEFGRGVPRDFAKALELYKQAAAQGLADAQSYLGCLYAIGRDVPQDYVQALQWLKQAAVQGHMNAQACLGEQYYRGLGVPQDYVQALQWYKQAAAQGDESAQFYLGEQYYKGLGVPQDYVKAREWYKQPAAQGRAQAQFQLGRLYDNGQGVPQDYKEAMRWYRLAAGQRYADALNNLGNMYSHGNGVLQDNVQAHMWFNIAAAQGSKNAPTNLDIVAKKMTPAQIAEAQKLAREWKP